MKHHAPIGHLHRHGLYDRNVNDADLAKAHTMARNHAEARAAAEAAIAPVYDIEQILADEHFRARNDVITVEDPELGPVRMQNVVGKFSETPGGIERAGPKLGEHNREVLIGELGFSEEEVRKAGVELG